jgi:hypothetical protein
VSVTKTEVYTILRAFCIVSNRLTYMDSKLSEMEILAQPLRYNKKSKSKYLFQSNLSLIFDIEMVNCYCFVAMYICYKLCINLLLPKYPLKL